MTNAELIAKIKAEIERQIELHDSLASNAESEMIANLEIGAAQGLDDILSFLSSLESEKPLGLEEEIKRYYDDWDGDCRYAQTARHFAQWGAEHAREQMMKELRSYCLSEIGRFPEGNDTSRATRETYYDIIGYLDENYGCK